MSKFSGGRLAADPVVTNRDQYYDMLRGNVQSNLGAGVTGLDILDDTLVPETDEAVAAAYAAGEPVSEVDRWEQAVRGQNPDVIQQVPETIDQLEANARNAYGIPAEVSEGVPTRVPEAALGQQGFNFREFSDRTKSPMDLIEQGTVSPNLTKKGYDAKVGRNVKSPMTKTQSESTVKQWMADQQAFVNTFAKADGKGWEVQGGVEADNPLNIMKKYFGHLDNNQVLSLLFAAGMGGFRQERHVNVDEQDRIEFNLDPAQKFYAGEREGRPRDFRIIDKVGNLIEDNSFTKMPEREKKILSAAVADSIASTPSLDISKQYEGPSGEILASDNVAGAGNVNVFYDYSDVAAKTFGHYEGLILEANPSLRINLRTSPVSKGDFNDMTPLRGQRGFNHGKSVTRGKADRYMSEEGHLLDEKLLAITDYLLGRQSKEQVVTTNIDEDGRTFEVVSSDPWKKVFKKTGPQVVNAVFQQYKLLSEQGTNVFYQTSVRYINGRSGYKESVNTKSNTFLRAASLPLSAQTAINLNSEDEVNALKEDIASMLGGAGLLPKAKLAFYEQNKDTFVKLGRQLEMIGSQAIGGQAEVQSDINPKELGEWMPEKFDSVQALREAAKLEAAVVNKDRKKQYHTYFVVEGDSTASGPSIIAQVMASVKDLMKTGAIPGSADTTREKIIDEEMHQANADAGKHFYESARQSDESEGMTELDNFLRTAFDSLDTAFSRGLAKGYSTPSIYGSSALGAKEAYALDLWEEANQEALLSKYDSEEISDSLFKVAGFMEQGFNSENKNLGKFKKTTQDIGRKMSELGILSNWVTTGKDGKNTDLIPHVQMSDGLRIPFFSTKFTTKETIVMSNPNTGVSVLDISEAGPDYERETDAILDPQAFDQATYQAKIDAKKGALAGSILGDAGKTNSQQGKDVSSLVTRHIVVLSIQALDNLIESRFINKFKSKYPDVYVDVVFDAIRVPSKYRKEAFKMYNDIHKEITFGNNVIKKLGEALINSVNILEADTALMKRLVKEGKIDEFKKLKQFAEKTLIKGKDMTKAYRDLWDTAPVDDFFANSGIETLVENLNLK